MEEHTPDINEHPQDIPEADFSFDGYQVVRGEFFAHVYEPSITFKGGKFYVNTACLRKLPDVDYVLILVNPNTKKLVIRPCTEDTKDATPWRTPSKKPKQITCRLFFAMVMKLMEWNPDYRYKVLGKLIRSNGELIFVFDLSDRQAYPCTITEDNKVKMSRLPSYPAEWENQFGLPVDEHQKQLQINIFNGYSVFSLIDKASQKNTEDDHHVEIQQSQNSD